MLCFGNILLPLQVLMKQLQSANTEPNRSTGYFINCRHGGR